MLALYEEFRCRNSSDGCAESCLLVFYFMSGDHPKIIGFILLKFSEMPGITKLNPSIKYKGLSAGTFHHMLKLNQTLCYKKHKHQSHVFIFGGIGFFN